ncbi:hypothetical protein [Halomonas sp.]|uniref:hypothetical protein n=1 Tax=Halomonas sp. TaxID=1486246 RepID=UPI003D0D4507
MPNHGGRYEIRDGKRELVQRTKPAPDPDPQPKAPAKPAAKADPTPEPKPATKPAAKQSDDVKESDNG